MSTYTVDIEKVTCNCPDFKFRRSRFGKNDIQRRCKHLAELMKDIPIIEAKTWSEKKRHDRKDVEKLAELVTRHFAKYASIEKFEFCGSFRRGKLTIGDLDVVIVKKDDDWSDNVSVLNNLYDIAEKILTKGTQKSSILLGDIQIDFRFVKAENFATQVAHATGSKEHNIKLRALAKSKGLTLNEYGIFKSKEKIEGIYSEEDIYRVLGVPFVKPENR